MLLALCSANACTHLRRKRAGSERIVQQSAILKDQIGESPYDLLVASIFRKPTVYYLAQIKSYFFLPNMQSGPHFLLHKEEHRNTLPHAKRGTQNCISTRPMRDLGTNFLLPEEVLRTAHLYAQTETLAPHFLLPTKLLTSHFLLPKEHLNY